MSNRGATFAHDQDEVAAEQVDQVAEQDADDSSPSTDG